MNKKQLLIAAGAFLLGVLVGSLPGDDSTEVVQAGQVDQEATATSEATTAATAAPTTTTTVPPTTTTTVPPTTTTTAPPQWVQVATLSGTGDKNGPPFELHGAQQRIRYSCSMPADRYVGRTSFWVEFERFSCETSEGAPSASGDSALYLDAGSYHFEVNATPNNSWSITLEELR